MRTIPLYGKHAQGRVALVDDEDHEFLMQHRWQAFEVQRGTRIITYARTSLSRRDNAGRAPGIFMHVMLMSGTGVDHIDHDGLNNQRSNLRPATAAQNAANRRKRSDARWSTYKGVHLVRRRWRAVIICDGRRIHLGYFTDELCAAYAYDQAAREVFGPYACTNFDSDPPQAVLDKWLAEPDAEQAAAAERGQAHSAMMSEWWKGREAETRTCMGCGERYQSRSKRSLYCSRSCWSRAYRQGMREQERERERECRLF